MIYLLTGTNTYLAEQELQKIIANSSATVERLDTGVLTDNTLADIIRGGSLFSEKRLIVLRQLSNNKQLFDKFADWSSEVSDDTTIVLVEQKLDKRTKSYKTVVKHAQIIAAEPLGERDYQAAEQWLDSLANSKKVLLSRPQLRDMVQRALVPGEKPATRLIDQMQLAQAVKALTGVGAVTDDMIATILPPAPGDTIFDLLDMAAKRQASRVESLLEELERSDDPHRTMALVMGQWAQLVSVALADGSSATIAVELGLHPYVAKKQQELANAFTPAQLRQLTKLAADLDAGSKLSQFTPWDGVHRFIYAIVQREA